MEWNEKKYFSMKRIFSYKNSNTKTASFTMFKLCIKVFIYENGNGITFSSKFKLLRCYGLWLLWLMKCKLKYDTLEINTNEI